MKYKIIIPKKELKCLTKLEIAKNIAAIGIGKEEPKQETLEEAIKQELENHFFSNISEIKQAEYFINFGAEWQQEQDKKMYSEEDMINLVEQLKDYTKESHTILGHDKRDAKEFVNIFKKLKKK